MQCWEIKKKICAALPLLPNYERYFQVQSDFYTNRGAAIVSHTWKHYLIGREKLFKHRFHKVREDLVLICTCQQTSSCQTYTMFIFNSHNASTSYHFLVENKANSRTSLFEEGAPDVAKIGAQEPFLEDSL